MEANRNSAWWDIAPPLCQALAPIDPIRGQQNLNDVWEGEVLVLDGPHANTVQRSVFKRHTHPGKLPVEMACTLVAGALGNDVPMPCLVQARAQDLPGLPQQPAGQGDLLMFGCTYIQQDRFFEQLSTLADSTLDGAVWNHFCGDAPKAAKAAALDELITNWDRHPRNLRFDGTRWWLIDHDNSLRETEGKVLSEMEAGFKAHTNWVAGQLLERRRADHGMPDAARLAAARQQQILALSAKITTQWRNNDPRVSNIWQHTADLVNLISRRLPMLQALLGERIGAQTAPSLQWPSTPQQPPAPS